jgi:hypothetical protein
MRAKSREEYKAAWEYHIRELASLALAADIPLQEWDLTRNRLFGWIDRAADSQKFETDAGLPL